MSLKKVIYNPNRVQDNSIALRISLIGTNSKTKKESFNFKFKINKLNEIDIKFGDNVNIWTELENSYIYVSKSNDDLGLKLSGGVSMKDSGDSVIVLNSDLLVSQNADLGPMLVGLRNRNIYYSKICDCDVIENDGIKLIRFKISAKLLASKNNSLKEQILLV